MQGRDQPAWPSGVRACRRHEEPSSTWPTTLLYRREWDKECLTHLMWSDPIFCTTIQGFWYNVELCSHYAHQDEWVKMQQKSLFAQKTQKNLITTLYFPALFTWGRSSTRVIGVYTCFRTGCVTRKKKFSTRMCVKCLPSCIFML